MTKLILIILDGYGYRKETRYNAISSAETPVLDDLFASYPSTTILCSGLNVGLPDGMMGNSEVGHLNIGAGRVVRQMMVRINESIESGEFFRNKALISVIESVTARRSKLHLVGLASEGGVHSSLDHLYAILDMVQGSGLKEVYLHAFTDGRDTPPDSGIDFMRRITATMDEKGVGRVATVAGRYYGMDRDKRWDRTERAYRAMIWGEGEKFADPVDAIDSAYRRSVTDEFIEPVVIFEGGKPIGKISDGDGVIAFNFRADRMRQITMALTSEDFREFESESPKISYATMTEYAESYSLPVAFESVKYDGLLGEVLSGAGLRQLRISETEKYAHVTYFMNGGREHPFDGERRIMIPSPKVSTYDLKPEMSASEVTESVIKEIISDESDVIILNYANCDMVGHTGDFEAAKIAAEAVDNGVGRIVPFILQNGWICMITADHGNAETMVDTLTGKPHTAHTTNPVPFLLVGADGDVRLRRGGRLADIAPTILDYLGLQIPDEMTGESLITGIPETSEINKEEKIPYGV